MSRASSRRMSGIFLKGLPDEVPEERKEIEGKSPPPRRMSGIFIRDIPAAAEKANSPPLGPDEIPTISAAWYDGGYVYSSKLGDLCIQGSVFFVMPAGELPRILTEKLSEAQLWLNEQAKEVLDSSPGFYDKFQNIAENAFYLAPGLRWPDKKMKTFLKANAFLWSLDDYCDNAAIRGIAILERQLIFEVGNIITGIFMGKYAKAGDICLERLGDAFDPLCRLMFSVYEELRAIVGNGYLGKVFQMANSWRNLVIHSLAHVTPSGQMWEADDLHMAIRAQSGVIPIVELIALLENVTLSDDVRGNFLFNTMYAIGNLISGMANDVICIKKEVECNEIAQNFALRKVVKDGMTLKQAMDFTIKREQQMSLDYIKMRKIILDEWFPEDKELRRFVEIIDYFVDGSIYLYLVGQRWGKDRTYRPIAQT